jgi:hypothetical protein
MYELRLYNSQNYQSQRYCQSYQKGINTNIHITQNEKKKKTAFPI